ncbi:MAG: undecaprenyl/decaprenyl-phosphate alpha-N-acetylglucosaminyl 1-phosphate transferase [Bifidobacteriaceae bacterium]|nr:undecaprenyl/decaprenyl-phosphate alpha-N-acetylglucosaminyl 1-phosphate transferase [Bifidobacteriaceae bacterium]
MKVYISLCLISLVVTWLMVPLVRRLAVATHAMTKVRARDIHTVPTPRLGGLAMAAGAGVGLFVASHIPFLQPVFQDSNAIWGVAVAALFVTALGAVDDWYELSWPTKLAGQVLAGGFLAWKGVQLITFPIAGLTIPSARLSLIATIVVVVAACNAINFTDGLDGLAAGLVAIGCTAFFVYSYLLSRQSNSESYASLAALILSVTVGACLGFLRYNWHPAKIFMGDSGSMLLGMLFAAATIAVTGQTDPGSSAISQRQAFGALLPILLPFAVLALPLLDMVLAVGRRMAKGLSPFHADKMHLHHRLLRLGHTQRRAAAIMYLWTAIPAFGGAGLAVLRARQVAALMGTGLILALILTFGPGGLVRRRRKGAKAAPDDAPAVPDDAPGVPGEVAGAAGVAEAAGVTAAADVAPVDGAEAAGVTAAEGGSDG